MEQVNGIGIVREFTGLTSEWGGTGIQGQEMEEIQTESMGEIENLNGLLESTEEQQAAGDSTEGEISGAAEDMSENPFSLSGKDKAVWGSCLWSCLRIWRYLRKKSGLRRRYPAEV